VLMIAGRIATLAALTVLFTATFAYAQTPVAAAPSDSPTSSAGPKQKEPEPCTVSGRVVSAAESTPLRRFVVN